MAGKAKFSVATIMHIRDAVRTLRAKLEERRAAVATSTPPASHAVELGKLLPEHEALNTLENAVGVLLGAEVGVTG